MLVTAPSPAPVWLTINGFVHFFTVDAVYKFCGLMNKLSMTLFITLQRSKRTMSGFALFFSSLCSIGFRAQTRARLAFFSAE
jgi:hypothetical protein